LDKSKQAIYEWGQQLAGVKDISIDELTKNLQLLAPAFNMKQYIEGDFSKPMQDIPKVTKAANESLMDLADVLGLLSQLFHSDLGAAIGDFAGQLYSLGQNWGKIKESFTSGFGQIKGAFKEGGGGFMGLLGGAASIASGIGAIIPVA